MDLDTFKMPKTKSSIVSKVLSRILTDAERSIKGEAISKDTGFFGEIGELAAYALIRSSGGEAESLAEARAVDDLLQRVYRDEVSEISEAKLIECLTLGFYGLVFAKYDDEDFRYLYRYAMRAIRKYSIVEEWLKKALVFEALLHDVNP